MIVSAWWLLVALGLGMFIGLCLATMFTIRRDADRRVHSVVGLTTATSGFDDLLGPNTVM
jgi:hypothetical protein